MIRTRTTLLITTAVATGGLLCGGALPAQAVAGATALGHFQTALKGHSLFVQSSPTTVTVLGAYRRLPPSSPYFTVIYGNAICDPAQAFPVGPFFSGRRGRAVLSTTVPTTVPGLVAGTMSVSVRIGDTAADLDHDGKVGPTDVVAVPGQPSIGLVECDTMPVVTPGL